jgi:hypothetical protein
MSTLIRVGHSAYKGLNSYRLCFSRAQAVRVLRMRGVKRDDARTAVQKAVTNGGATAYAGLQGVEVVNQEWAFQAGHFYSSYSELKAKWSTAPEQ